MFKGNLEACVSLITTGVRFVELNRFAEQMRMSLFSSTFFWKGESGLQMATDGAYDSRGYSTSIGKVDFSDTLTKLILRTEVLHCSETDEISQRMEIEGLRRLLRWISAKGLRVASLTTDRSRSVGKLLREMEEETGVIQHYYDGWHLVKWLGNELLKVSKKRGCALLLERHRHRNVGARSQLDIPPIFNTCLMHVRDVHEWEEEDITGSYNCCSHGELVGPRPETLPLDSDAYQAFRDIAKLATMHINTLRLAEMAGERNVLKVIQIQRKYNRRKSTIVFKSPVPHKWRDDVLDEVLSARVRMLDSHKDCFDSDQLPDEIGEMMMAEKASESGYSVEL
ncbi:hypothetical protein ANCDUO_00972 [Ancylostoma duodenale]|uniref:Transposase n=1 Tax=Ancylostoma duodenale TaxID=51022 RepID=A0A0C2HGG1_9BILA|nr:hypothetical protein ANCDUO_00972 [Ancylostoma duodenale]